MDRQERMRRNGKVREKEFTNRRATKRNHTQREQAIKQERCKEKIKGAKERE